MKNIFSNPAKKFIRKKRHVERYIFILLILAVLLWFPKNFINQYSFGFIGAESGSTAVKIKKPFSFWWAKFFGGEKINSLEKEKEILAKENAKLKEQIKEKEIQFENNELNSSYDMLELPVIGKDNFLGTPLLFLFGGNDLKIRVGMPVLDNQGSLVGTIKESQQKISQVILTPNHDSRVGGRIAGTNWNGVVEGNRDLRAVLEMLPLDSQFELGDQVVTDNGNPDIPVGILIGTVSFTKESDDHLFKEAVLNLPWNSDELDKVWVVTGRK